MKNYLLHVDLYENKKELIYGNTTVSKKRNSDPYTVSITTYHKEDLRIFL